MLLIQYSNFLKVLIGIKDYLAIHFRLTILKVCFCFHSSGRARAMDSKYHALAQIGKGTAAKEEVNIRREKLMAKAINELQGDIQQNPPSIRKNIRKLQEEDKLDRDLQTQQKK
ncbi:hypothetical protein ACJMK2_004851 [Sinanodonta woodiana]|uniref:Uncharacterized protein n=1 Tax=Sinanodonta woodiana TaxID=1069815 RepID=A0ABD3VN94_SINWO